MAYPAGIAIRKPHNGELKIKITLPTGYRKRIKNFVPRFLRGVFLMIWIEYWKIDGIQHVRNIVRATGKLIY